MRLERTVFSPRQVQVKTRSRPSTSTGSPEEERQALASGKTSPVPCRSRFSLSPAFTAEKMVQREGASPRGPEAHS